MTDQELLDTVLGTEWIADSAAPIDIVSRIHQLLLQPGGAKKFLTRGQAIYLLRTAPLPNGIVARTRHDLARELIEELTTIDAKIRSADSSCASSSRSTAAP